MMTDAEVQLVTYVEAVLRQRGHADVAEMLNGVVDVQLERRARLTAPRVSLRTATDPL